MDWMIILIGIGLVLSGIVVGIPIGQAIEHRRLLAGRSSRHSPPLHVNCRNDLSFGDMKTPTVLSKEEIEDILNAREIS